VEVANLDIGNGLTLLLGPNGAGKSTLLKMIAGVERPDHGTIEIDGFDLWKQEVAARQKIAYVPEYPDLTPYATIEDVMALVCRLRSEPIDSALRVLDRVGLRHLSNRSIRELSMGQRRRAVMAAAWIGHAQTVLLDEPLESMDRLIRESILAWVGGLKANGATIIIATHQVDPFIDRADTIVAVRNGGVTKYSPLPSDPTERRRLVDSL
jgi:ABC-type multidrug transport system ATPase subunit